MANLAEIKGKLGVQSLPLNRGVTEAGEETAWFKHWDNDNRVAILIHEDTLAQIKANSSIDNLGINTQTKLGAQGEYTAKYICNGEPADETL